MRKPFAGRGAPGAKSFELRQGGCFGPRARVRSRTHLDEQYSEGPAGRCTDGVKAMQTLGDHVAYADERGWYRTRNCSRESPFQGRAAAEA
jgi:hypothetical protein